MTKTLYLLRHGKSSWDDPAVADHDRPLAPRGRRAAKTIAGHLRVAQISPDLVLCSSSTRTRETLTRVSKGFGEAGPVEVAFERGIYEASGAELLNRLRRVPDEIGAVMLIGHQPGIQDLALALLLADGSKKWGRLAEKFPTAALATLTFSGPWGQLEPGSARLAAFVKPRELPEAA